MKNIDSILENISKNDLSDLPSLVKLLKSLQNKLTNGEGLASTQSQICNNEVCDLFSITSESVVTEFLKHVFAIRFGWTEDQKQRKIVASKENSDIQKEVNKYLDEILHSLKNHAVTSQMVQTLALCIDNAKEKPIVRNHTSIFLLDWITCQLEDKCDSDSLRQSFEEVQSALFLVIQDVWSAIRKSCVGRLGPIVRCMDLEQLQLFYNGLIKVCCDQSKSWQAHDGSIMALHCIIKKFHWKSEDLDDSVNNSATYRLVFGDLELEGMPAFISDSLKDCVFQLLRHEQLTVREYAVKTYTTYISKSDLNVAVTCFKDVVSHLLPRSNEPNGSGQSNFQFVDDYEAESLLGICEYLIKHIPPHRLNGQKTHHFSTFRLYLSHPASTVRQAASSIFKYIVSRESSNPTSMKFILQGLCCDWVPDMELLLSAPPNEPTPLSPRPSIVNISGEAVASAWEYREGRLLAYELIMQFLIKNHWLYTFGTSYLNTTAEPVVFTVQETKRGGRRRSSLSDMTTFSQILAAKQKGVLEEEAFCNQSGTLSKARSPQRKTRKHRSSISGSNPSRELDRRPSFNKSDIPLCSSFGSGHRHDIVRLATITGTSSAFSHVIQKHYSYYARAQNGDQEQGGETGTSELARHRATSLIMACQEEEIEQSQTTLSPRTLDKVTSAITDPCVSVCNGHSNTETETSSMHGPFSSLTALLERIFYQTVECLADERWELRRMGSQLLPCVVEVLRWLDMRLLGDIWDSQIEASGTLLSYGACLTLQYSLAHAARLQHILSHPPSNWQDPALCRRLILEIVDPVRLKAGGWAQLVYQLLLNRTAVDRLTLVALHTLMLVHTYFELTTSNKFTQLNRIVTVIQLVFSRAHGECSLTPPLREKHFIYRQRLYTPTAGFLSCCTRSDDRESGIAQQVERQLLLELQRILPSFLRIADFSCCVELLPTLCYQLGVYLQDDDLFKLLTESIQRLVERMSKWTQQPSSCQVSASNQQPTTNPESALTGSFTVALDQLTDILVHKTTLDQHTLRQLCDLITTVATCLPPRVYLHTLATKLTPRVNTKPQYNPPATTNGAPGLRRVDTDVNLLLHAPRPSLGPLMPATEVPSDDEEEEDRVHINGAASDCRESETLHGSALAASGGSGRMHPTVADSSAESQSEGIASDWDSWDDEQDTETGDAGFTMAVQMLMGKLQAASYNKFAKEIQALPDRERNVVLSLLH